MIHRALLCLLTALFLAVPSLAQAGEVVLWHAYRGGEREALDQLIAQYEANNPGVQISPLALPVLAGPGTIATAMNFAAESTLPEVARVLGAFGLMCVATWATFLGSESVTRFLGQNAIKVVTRLMGLILAVIGVQMLIEGVGGAAALSSAS